MDIHLANIMVEVVMWVRVIRIILVASIRVSLPDALMIMVMRLFVVVVVMTLLVQAKINDMNWMVVEEDIDIHDWSAKFKQMIGKYIEVSLVPLGEHRVFNESQIFLDLSDIETLQVGQSICEADLMTDLVKNATDVLLFRIDANFLPLWPEVTLVERQ